MKKPLLSRVLGAVGLVLVATSAVTLFFGNTRFLLGKLVLAAACVAASFALGESGGLRRFFTGRALHFGAVTAVSALALVVALGAANWLAYQRPKSWDLTKNRIFTLQEDTVRTLRALRSPVKALAVYRLDEEGYAQARALLERYAAVTPRFTYELVDPYKNPEKARAYGVLSSGPRILLLAGSQRAPASAADEQGVTNALVKVTRSAARKIYFLAGHGEPDLASQEPRGYALFAKALTAEGYEVEPLSLAEQGRVPADAAVLVVAGARKALLPPELKLLDAYADQGGHLGLFLEPEADAGLDKLLARFGVQADDDVVVDPSPAAQLLGSPVSPIALPSGAHPISRELADTALVLPTARSLVALTQSGVTPTPLALTGSEAWGETDLKGVFERGQARRDEGEKGGPLPLAMAAEKPVSGQDQRPARLVAAGDSDFFTNQYLQLGGNRDFAMNALSWLAEQEDRITLRPRSREASLVLLTDAQASALKFLSVDVLPVALLVVGLAVWMVRRSR